MFGPDRCGGTNKVHFILQHKRGCSADFHMRRTTSNTNESARCQVFQVYTRVAQPCSQEPCDAEMGGETPDISAERAWWPAHPSLQPLSSEPPRLQKGEMRLGCAGGQLGGGPRGWGAIL